MNKYYREYMLCILVMIVSVVGFMHSPLIFNSTTSSNVVEGQSYWFRETMLLPGMCQQDGATPLLINGNNQKFSACQLDTTRNLYLKKYACENVFNDGALNPGVNVYGGYYNDASCTDYRAGEDLIYYYQTCNCLDYNCQYDCTTTDEPWLDDPPGYIYQEYIYDSNMTCMDEVKYYELKPNGCIATTYMDCPKAYSAIYSEPNCQGSPLIEETLVFKDCKSQGGSFTTKCT